MANPNYQTTDERQRDLDNHPENRFEPTQRGTWGVSGAAVDRRTIDKPRRQFSQNSNSAPSGYANESNPVTEPEFDEYEVSTPQTKKRGLKRKAVGTLRLLTIRARLTPVVAGISVVASAFYIAQLCFGLMAIGGLGIAIMLGGVDGVVTEVATAVTSWVFNFSTGLLIYFVFCFLIFVLNLFIILFAAAIFKGALVHPWFGTGAGFKLGSILFILISSFIPLLNMLPLFWLWVYAVVLHPK